MSMTALVAQLALVAVEAVAAPICEPADCLQRIRLRVPAADIAAATKIDLVGVWDRGGGLGGDVLYLFADTSYFATEWSDVGLVERVCDQGHWQLLERAVHLSPTAGWEHVAKRDRRYLPVSLAGHDPYLLLGVDDALRFFEDLSASQGDIAPQEWLSAAAFKRQRVLRPSETQRLKARLMRGAVPIQSRQPGP